MTREELAALRLRDRIHAVIGAAEKNQDEFADEIGATRETVNRWVNGQARPGRAFRVKLAEIATRAYNELISPDMFREYVTDRPTPIEEAASHLVETGRVLAEALEALTQIADQLAPLLEHQEALVREMQKLVAELRGRGASSGGGGGAC
jgi:transcriptional regulator with XRE-family HTH domain